MAVSTSKPTHPLPSPLSMLIQTTTSTLPIPDSTAALLSLPLEILHNLQHQHAWSALELHYLHPTRHTLHHLPLPSSSSSPPPQNPHPSSGTIPQSTTQFLLSGLPPRHAYIHPDAQMRLLRHGRTQRDLRVQREWVVPMALAQNVNVQALAGVFDALPEREGLGFVGPGVEGVDGAGIGDGHGDALRDDVDGSETTPPRLPAHDRPKPPSTSPSKPLTGRATASSAPRPPRSGPTAPEHEYEHEHEYPNPQRVLLAMKARDGLGGDGTVAYYVCLQGEVKPRQNG